MSVLKSKRKESPFEVYHNLKKLRKDITDLLLRDFGYNDNKAQKKVDKYFNNKVANEVQTENGSISKERRYYNYMVERNIAFDDWFIARQRNIIMTHLQDIVSKVYRANSIYPNYYEEYIERRMLQDDAIGLCYTLMQELEYTIETLPVSIDVYLRFADTIKYQVNLIKNWRKSDNRFNKWVNSDCSTNFANVNNNGNANNNNSSNTNIGVRPDSENII